MGGSSSQPTIPLSEDSKKILAEIKQHPVVIYSKDGCGYCVKAKEELDQDKIKYTEKNINVYAQQNPDGVQAYLKGLIDLTHQRTVPQIFVCGKFVGGYTELNALRPNLATIVETCSLDRGQTLRDEIAAKL